MKSFARPSQRLSKDRKTRRTRAIGSAVHEGSVAPLAVELSPQQGGTDPHVLPLVGVEVAEGRAIDKEWKRVELGEMVLVDEKATPHDESVLVHRNTIGCDRQKQL